MLMPEHRVSGILPLKNGTIIDVYYTPQQRPDLLKTSVCPGRCKKGMRKGEKKRWMN